MSQPQLPISAYQEAFSTTRTRHFTLRRMHPVAVRGRSHRVTRDTVVFTLSDGSELWTLTLPLTLRFGVWRETMERRVRKSCRLEQLADARFLFHALTLFDREGRSYVCEGLLQRYHTPLEEFVRTNSAPSQHYTLRRALESLAELPYCLIENGIHHGSLNSHNITFDHRGEVRLMDYAIAGSSEVYSDGVRIAECAILLYLVGCNGELGRVLSVRSRTTEEYRRRLEQILAGAEYYAIDSLALLVRHILMESSAESIARALEGLAGEPFRPLPMLVESLCGGGENVPRCDADALREPSPAEPERVDFDSCDEVVDDGEVVRYRCGGRWGYALHDGTHITTHRLLLTAYEFSHGRAVVRTPRGYGLMDITGRMFMNDVWDELCWHSQEGVVTACNERGEWHIFDHLGRQLSSKPAEWMGDSSEGFIVARRGGKYGYYAVDGTKATDFIYEEAFGFSRGFARVSRGGAEYFIDTSFHRVSPRLERLIINMRAEEEW